MYTRGNDGFLLFGGDRNGCEVVVKLWGAPLTLLPDVPISHHPQADPSPPVPAGHPLVPKHAFWGTDPLNETEADHT